MVHACNSCAPRRHKIVIQSGECQQRICAVAAEENWRVAAPRNVSTVQCNFQSYGWRQSSRWSWIFRGKGPLLGTKRRRGGGGTSLCWRGAQQQEVLQ